MAQVDEESMSRQLTKLWDEGVMVRGWADSITARRRGSGVEMGSRAVSVVDGEVGGNCCSWR